VSSSDLLRILVWVLGLSSYRLLPRTNSQEEATRRISRQISFLFINQLLVEDLWVYSPGSLMSLLFTIFLPTSGFHFLRDGEWVLMVVP
jgi:hypothetical protein